jgi:hypothetical protein
LVAQANPLPSVNTDYSLQFVTEREKTAGVGESMGLLRGELMSDAKTDVNKENEKTGQQGTNEPWKRPGQASQNPSDKGPNTRARREKDNETA